METDQLKLLFQLAKSLKEEKRDKKSALASLQSAKILTKKGNFTKQYKHLEKLVAQFE